MGWLHSRRFLYTILIRIRTASTPEKCLPWTNLSALWVIGGSAVGPQRCHVFKGVIIIVPSMYFVNKIIFISDVFKFIWKFMYFSRGNNFY